MGLFSASQAPNLEVGMQAPQFELFDQAEIKHSLSGYLGKWVVLYFYPKDDTPGCTKQACAFRDDMTALNNLDVQVLGVSVDTATSHAKFADKFNLQFPLLADLGGQVTNNYGCLTKLGPVKLAKRHTFIIDPKSRLAKIYRSVSPATHSEEVITAIHSLK